MMISHTHKHIGCYLFYQSDRDRFEIQRDLDRGYVVDWPMEFKHPCKKNTRCKPHFLAELRYFFEDLYESDLEYIKPRINKFGRCAVAILTQLIVEML